MKNFDYLALDGRMLRTFLIVLEENSVSRAAARLGVTQSSVSHTLNSLRQIIGDPLFLRSGRGIRPTSRAKSLREQVQSLLDNMKSLTAERVFDPNAEKMEFVVAANDFQRDLLFPPLLRELEAEGIDTRFSFLPGGVPTINLLQEARCHLVITPFPPQGADIIQSALFEDHVACFFDSEMRDAPNGEREFLASEYIEVRFADYTSALEALSSLDVAKLREPKITVPNFAALADFIKGTQLITTQISSMKLGPLAGLDTAELPFENERLTLYLAWHRREHSDPAHTWLRQRLKAVAHKALNGQ